MGSAGSQFPRERPLWVMLPLEADPPAMLADMPEAGLAYSYDGKKKAICSQADAILDQLLGPGAEKSNIITYSEDDKQSANSWDCFPQVGAALRGASDTDEGFCVAICQSRGVWGVGVSEKGAARYNAARIALAAQLVIQEEEASNNISLDGKDAMLEVVGAARNASPPQEPVEGMPKKKRLDLQPPKTAASKTKPAANSAAKADPARAMRDKPVWVSVPPEALRSPHLEYMGDTALVISSDGKFHKMYADVDRVIEHILGGPDAASAVEYIDDQDFTVFESDVGPALHEAAFPMECVCVAVHPALTVWAVGVSMKPKTRIQAAKLALAVTVFLQSDPTPEEEDDMRNAFPAFTDCAAAARDAAEAEGITLVTD